MKLDKLYKMQEELDKHILANEKKRTGKEIDKDVLLNQTIVALLVEVGELANATRCFKHWSVKGPESKERLLDELADIWHFYLSIGNQRNFEMDDIYEYYSHNELKNDKAISMELAFIRLLSTGDSMSLNLHYYTVYGHRLEELAERLGFTDEEVEQAYLKKHEENYRRQEEGY